MDFLFPQINKVLHFLIVEKIRKANEILLLQINNINYILQKIKVALLHYPIET
jgi:hypothetical protein